MLFSQRYGLKPIKTTIQIDFIDTELRSGLWNRVVTRVLEPLREYYTTYVMPDLLVRGKGKAFVRNLWHHLFEKPIDTIPNNYPRICEYIRNYYFQGSFDDVYDILEWIAQNHYSGPLGEIFVTECNQTLEKELSGYRFVDDKIVRITSDEEITAVEEAVKIPDPFKGPRTQIKSALKKLSDRKSPDYRGSIKESISAVEGIARIIAKQQVKSFDDALIWMKRRRIMDLHLALEDAFKKMYAYTSGSKQGIRHALLEEPNLTFEDAKYMLVVWSAFINYLIAKLPRGKNNR